MRSGFPRIAARTLTTITAAWLALSAARGANAAADGAWVRINTAHSPGSRFSAAAAYDPHGQRMLLFGGQSGQTLLCDVWQLSLSGAPDWTQVTSCGGPSARANASAIYDPVDNQLVVYGGFTASGTPLGDVWVLSLGATPAWTKVDSIPSTFRCYTGKALGPCPRGQHSSVWNSNLRTMWMSCGMSCVERNDLWSAALTGSSSAWTKLGHGTAYCDSVDYEESLPDTRAGQSLIYDARNRDVVVFGGDYQGQPGPSNTWQTNLDGSQWTEISTSSPSGTHVFHTAVYDSMRARMVVFGGCETDSTIALDLTPGNTPAWSTLRPCGSTPGYMANHVAIFDPVGDRMVLFDPNGNTWALEFSPPGPNAVSDLGVKSAGATSLYLRWTAPNDTVCGRASSYDLRYSTSAISDDASFASATQVSGEPTPSSPGARDSMNVTGLLQGTTYWFAIKSSNRVGGVSALSNVLSMCWYVNPFRLCDGGQMAPVHEERPQALALGIQSVQPNPARGALEVAFTLPREGDATLSLFDVAGRLVQRQDVGSMGAGAHQVRFGDDTPIPPGFFAVRLSQRGVTVTRSVIVVR